ncbi:MAG: hypothetical protein NTU93_12140 [Arthrobacter sp.]|nr:hypothetical protein [Arthrobacter sp.]
MPPSPSPTPVEVFLHSGPADWWQIVAALGPLAVLLSAVVAGIIGWRTLRQKAVADNRAEWWRRTQWALDSVYSGDKKRGTIGLKVLKVLGESPLAGSGELAVLEAATEKPLNSAARTAAARTARAPAEARPPAEARMRPMPSGAGMDGPPAPRDNEEIRETGDAEGATTMSTASRPVTHGAHAGTPRPVRAEAQAAQAAQAKAEQAEEVFDEDDRAMQVAAAQLREVTDRRLGKVTPVWVKALAREQPPGHTG